MFSPACPARAASQEDGFNSTGRGLDLHVHPPALVGIDFQTFDHHAGFGQLATEGVANPGRTLEDLGPDALHGDLQTPDRLGQRPLLAADRLDLRPQGTQVGQGTQNGLRRDRGRRPTAQEKDQRYQARHRQHSEDQFQDVQQDSLRTWKRRLVASMVVKLMGKVKQPSATAVCRGSRRFDSAALYHATQISVADA